MPNDREDELREMLATSNTSISSSESTLSILRPDLVCNWYKATRFAKDAHRRVVAMVQHVGADGVIEVK